MSHNEWAVLHINLSAVPRVKFQLPIIMKAISINCASATHLQL